MGKKTSILPQAGRPSDGKPQKTVKDLIGLSKPTRFTFLLGSAQHKKIKMIAIQKETTVADILRKYIDDFIKDNSASLL